jgi:hypothetical protein
MNEKLMRVDWYPEIPIDAPEFGYFIAVRQIAISEGFRCGIADEVGVFRLELDYPAAKAKFLCLAVSLEEGSRICAALNLADAKLIESLKPKPIKPRVTK